MRVFENLVRSKTQPCMKWFWIILAQTLSMMRLWVMRKTWTTSSKVMVENRVRSIPLLCIKGCWNNLAQMWSIMRRGVSYAKLRHLTVKSTVSSEVKGQQKRSAENIVRSTIQLILKSIGKCFACWIFVIRAIVLITA
jgi:hypothetical protein